VLGGISSSDTQFRELPNRFQVKFEEGNKKEICRTHMGLWG
jgi:hypothetical protein